MFRIDGAKLSLTRGDDAYLLVGASLAEGETLELRVYTDVNMTDLLFTRGRLPDQTFLINKADTDPLDFGVYYYCVVKVSGGTEEVVLGPDTLTVLEEVH